MNQSSPVAGYSHQHPMRSIDLAFMPGKTVLTKEDEKLMKQYIELHDFEYNMHTDARELFLSFTKMEPQMDAMKEELGRIKKIMQESIEMVDKLSEDFYVPDETNPEKIEENNELIIDGIREYHQQHNELFDQMDHFNKILTHRIETMDEDIDKMYGAYRSIMYKHTEHWEVNTIDIVAVDDDFNKFCSVRDMFEKRRSDFIERSEKIVHRYVALDLESKTLYRVWEEFSKRCDLLLVVLKLHQESVTASVN